MPMSRKMYKRPLPEACAFENRLHVQEILEYCGNSLFVFPRKNSGDRNESIVYISVLLLNPNSGINVVPSSNSAVFSIEPLHEEPRG